MTINSFFREQVLSSPYFSICMTIIAFQIGVYIQKKCKSIFANPLMIATVICIIIMKLCKMTYADYNTGASVLGLFLGPVNVILAQSIYNQRHVIKENLAAVLSAVIAGSIAAAASVYWLSKLFALDKIVIDSILPKSLTTPVAISIAQTLGGNTALTSGAVLITGITGAVLSPFLIKLFAVKNPVVQGLAIGCSGHALGTTTAFKLGEVQGALSSVSIGCMGLASTLMFAIVFL